MANQSLSAKRQASLSKSLRTLLSGYLEELRVTYLRMTEQVKIRQGATSWNYCLFECDISRELDLPDYLPAITPELTAFFEQHRIQVKPQQGGYSRYFLITVDLEKMQNQLTEQLCFAY